MLYSAGGNSADEHWYERDVIAYSFETGADRYTDTVLNVAGAVGDTGVRLANRNGFDKGDKITFEKNTTNAEVRVVDAVINPNPTSPAANVTLTEPLAKAHAVGTAVSGGITQSGVGFQPDYATEGKFEALEFAAGNYGLLESAFSYAKDTTPPAGQDDRGDPFGGPDRDDVRVRQRTVGDPLHDRRLAADGGLDRMGLHRPA